MKPYIKVIQYPRDGLKFGKCSFGVLIKTSGGEGEILWESRTRKHYFYISKDRAVRAARKIAKLTGIKFKSEKP